MIELSAAATWAPNGKLLLTPTNLIFQTGERVGILSKTGSGKTTLARLLAGIDLPKQGRITRTGPAATILGQENIIHSYMHIGPALQSAAELLGLCPISAPLAAFYFAGMDPQTRLKVDQLSPVQKSVLAFGLSIQRPTNWLIADDRVIPNDPSRTALANALIEHRLMTAGLIVISKNHGLLARYCDRFYVLTSASLMPVDDIRTGQTVLDMDRAA
ncbi:MAG: ATP-binding cassette domain-containing protein [Pseudomonadota bacterium]